ncbi:flagellar assembly peptidoglycan hydrolase FlgJ [Yersinia frederiksenii]|uniref:flagellar assembly peptidoglycan hydrolase FlgJ n=1 Tax=Yersinia frederiksenii TaxID=29484 RepID=UPI0005E7CC39|nr:flagellar assembly peptidoglycan hydrolase FlgJ [Yersinia frederiksenii]CNL76655.1 flagellar rod assembly protein/muramidase FlgJ [Yersinia frederiksenii]HEC1650511.1 flagellar assembly peptidoglycan hydrolase FlgJ [Yersinia enterocolitica]
MSGFNLNQGAAFDLRSLDSLKLAVKNDASQGAEAAAKQMEGLFVQMMLKSMREASFKGGLLDSPQSDMFTSMYDQQIAQDIAGSGKLGFAELIMSQLTGEKVETGRGTGGVPVELASSLSNFKGMPVPVTPQSDAPSPARYSGASSAHSFISRMLAPAIEAGGQSGIPHQLIIAQAALESGWGDREILTKEGKPSHNLFGIKATSAWKGETTEITTTEYIDGVRQKVKAVFKVYPSYSDALADYTSLLNNNPRYKNISQSSSPEIAAKVLQSGGYATDPRYANKLINIIQQVKQNVGQAVNAYKTDISSLF